MEFQTPGLPLSGVATIAVKETFEFLSLSVSLSALSTKKEQIQIP